MTPDELVEKVALLMGEAAGVVWDAEERRFYNALAHEAIRVVLEEAARVVWTMRRDPLTMQGDHHGKAGEWMRAALDDAETAIRALMPKENT
jgi:hypothetical protein